MRQLKGISEPELLRALDSAGRVLILGHISPDGDCVGSMLALGAILKKRGKTVSLCLQDPVPANLRFLPGADRILPPGQLEGERFDLGVAVDCADEGRMGEAARLFRLCPATAQIDHHATNPLYAGVNEVDGKASCAGCMIWRLMGEYHMEPDDMIAECLYSAISTDTGRFCFSCTDEETFLCAASAAAAAGRKGGRKGGRDRESERAGEHRTGGSGSTRAELTGGSAAADRAAAPPRARGIPTPTPHTPRLDPGSPAAPPPPGVLTHPLPRRLGFRLGPTEGGGGQSSTHLLWDRQGCKEGVATQTREPSLWSPVVMSLCLSFPHR